MVIASSFEKHREAFYLRSLGLKFREIADELNYRNPQKAWRAYHSAIKEFDLAPVDKSYVWKEFCTRLERPVWKTPPRMVSLFSGCGGLDLSFHKAGYDIVYANEFNEYAAKTFARNIDESVEVKPIEEVDIAKIPSADLVTGGFPCQDFSIIWKRPGLKGTRGNLYTYFLEFINTLKPKAFIAENVKGLMSANKGKAIQQIITDFQTISPGYLVFPKLYDFANHGVPQHRERVILVGIRSDLDFNFIHPKSTHGPDRGLPYVTAGTALENIDESFPNMQHMNIKDRTKEIIRRIPAGGNFTDIPEDDPYYVKGMISHVYRRIDPNKPSKTLIAGGGGGTWGYHYPENRALTNRERARIQSFPDDFIFEGSFTEIRRQIGNAVPPVGVIDIVNRLNPLFNGEYQREDLTIVQDAFNQLTIKERLKIATSHDEIDWLNLPDFLPNRLPL